MKVEIQIPSNLSEVTLEQYQKFTKLNTDENQDSSFLMHKTVEIFCNLNLQDIAKVKFTYVQEILNDINNLFEKKQDLIPTFTHRGIEYGLIPVLDDMTLGEYVDLDENFTDWDTMHKAMTVLYRPVTFKKGDRYQIEEYSGLDNAETMKQIPLDIVMGCMFFFWNLNEELLKTTLNYLSQEVPKELTTEQLQTLVKSGGGINQSMDSLKEMLDDLNISLN
ncbi:MAG: hypothetical protein ACKVJK_07140 [Methylophagaceae bacterium]